MTKKELLKKIQEAYEQLDELDNAITSVKEEAKAVRSLLEDIPEEENEITDDQEKDDD